MYPMHFVFDIDGTTSFNGLTLEPEVCDALRGLRAAGHTPLLASARPINDILPMLPGDLKDITCIGANGAVVWHEGKTRVRAYLPQDAFAHVSQLAQEHGIAYVANGEGTYAYCLPEGHFLHERLDVENRETLVELNQMQRAFKLILLSITDRALHQQLLDEIRALDVEVSEHDDPNGENIDIAATGVNKQAALNELLQGAPYIAFGNDTNDIKMLTHAAYSVAVGTKSGIIALCDRAVDPTGQAVAYAINKLVQSLNFLQNYQH